MSCSNDIQFGDIGTSFEIDITDTNKLCVVAPVDLTSTTSIVFKFYRETSKTSIDRIGAVFTGGTNGDATDGIAQYITVADDIDELGSWQGQVIVTFSNGSVFSSSIFKFKVRANLA